MVRVDRWDRVFREGLDRVAGMEVDMEVDNKKMKMKDMVKDTVKGIEMVHM